jgi:hypothetical protein
MGRNSRLCVSYQIPGYYPNLFCRICSGRFECVCWMGRAAFGRNETRSFASWQLIFALAESIYLMKALIGSPRLRGSNRPALRRLYAENDELPIKTQRRIAISELFFRC